MSFNAPTINPSGSSFADLATDGPRGVFSAMVAANSLTGFQRRLVEQGRWDDALEDLNQMVDLWRNGQPIATSEINQRLYDYSVAFSLLTAKIAEVATLVADNPGSLAPTGGNSSGAASSIRTWP